MSAARKASTASSRPRCQGLAFAWRLRAQFPELFSVVAQSIGTRSRDLTSGAAPGAAATASSRAGSPAYLGRPTFPAQAPRLFSVVALVELEFGLAASSLLEAPMRKAIAFVCSRAVTLSRSPSPELRIAEIELRRSPIEQSPSRAITLLSYWYALRRPMAGRLARLTPASPFKKGVGLLLQLKDPPVYRLSGLKN